MSSKIYRIDIEPTVFRACRDGKPGRPHEKFLHLACEPAQHVDAGRVARGKYRQSIHSKRHKPGAPAAQQPLEILLAALSERIVEHDAAQGLCALAVRFGDDA